MASFACSGCNRRADVPDEVPHAVIACGRCGRCLSSPPLGTDRRRGQRSDAVAPAVAGAAQLRGRRGTLPLILAGMILGVFGGLVMTRGLDMHHRLLGGVGAVLFLLSGGWLLTGSWRRSRSVGPALIVPLPDVLPQETDGIGQPTLVFHSMNTASALGFIVMGVVFCVAGAVGISAMMHGQAHGRMPEVAFVGTLAGVLAIVHGLRCLWSRYYLLVGPGGFLRLRGDRADVCRWDEIERFTEEVYEERKDQAWTSYTIERADGEKLVFKGNHLEDIQGFGAAVREGMLRRLLPDLQRRLAAGETLEFGKLQAGPDGLGSRDGTVPWEEVGGLHVTPSQLAVVRHGNLRSWCKVRTADVPNAFLLEALVRTRNVPVGSFRGVS